MCGICGQYNFISGRPVDARVIERMTRALVHRGPDSRGMVAAEALGMGVRRLAIIDVSGGDQPIYNEDETLAVVCNGEIYNAPALTEGLRSRGHRFRTGSDVEVILHLYEEHGDECAALLHGMFAFALWDERRRRLLLGRDAFGIKPLYYALTPEGIMWGSEVRALIAGGLAPRIDPLGLTDYLSYWYVPEPHTLLRDVVRLPAGHLLVAGEAGVSVRQFRELPEPSSQPSLRPQESRELVWQALGHSVARHLRSDVPVGLLLSGGIDSTLIAALARSAGADLTAFTIDFDVPSYSEAARARRTSRALGFPLQVVTVTAGDVMRETERVLEHMDDPIGDFSVLPSWVLYREARREVVVALSGDGGDELFAGYPTHFVHRFNHVYARLPRTMRRGMRALLKMIPDSRAYLSLAFRARGFLQGAGLPDERAHYAWKLVFADEEKRQLLAPDVREACRDRDSFLPMAELFARTTHFPDFVDRALFVDAKTFLLCDNLVKVDRMSMAHSLEVRVPFLDLEVAEAAARVPAGHKVRGTTTKFVLRTLLADRVDGAPARAPKQGFTPPLAAWMAGGLRELVGDYLSPESLRVVPMLRPEPIVRLWRDQLGGVRDRHRQVWALVALVAWYRRYVQSARAEPSGVGLAADVGAGGHVYRGG